MSGSGYGHNKNVDPAKYFWPNVRKSDGCWEWTGTTFPNGYGAVRVSSNQQGTHRVSWTLAFGKIPAGQWVLHRCDNRKCVRPEHLFLGTQTDNMRDMVAKGRGRHGRTFGERVHTAKLNPDKVREIRRRSAEGQSTRVIAKAFGVGATAIHWIVVGKRWRHVSEAA